MSTYVIGLDFGGGGGRCLLLDLETGSTTSSARSWQFPAAAGTGWLGYDVDLGRTWAVFAEATREAMARADAHPDEVVGIATSALRLGNVMLDAAGGAVFAVPNRDARAIGPGLALGDQHGEALYEATGRWPSPTHAAARLQWLRAERPDDFARIADLLSISDWLAFRLSGERACDPTQAGETLLFDLAERGWSDAWIERLGLPRTIFPSIREPGERLGSLTTEAAEALGLNPGIAVAVGAADTQCGLVGAGALDTGEVVAVAGSTGPIQLVADRPAIDPAHRLWTGPHVVPQRWVVESNCGSLGEALDWFARLLFPEAPQPSLRLLGEAATAPVGSRGLVSSLGADVMNARAMGMPVGHLTLSHLSSVGDGAPRRLLVRSVVEGMACAMRANLEQIMEVWGLERAPLRLTGGLSQSDTFAGIVAGVLGEAIRVPVEAGATALGAALCASVGAGAFPDLRSAAAGLVRTTDRLPDAAQAEDNAALYARWTGLRAARGAADAEAATIITPFALGAHRASDATTTEAARPRALVAADFDDVSLAALEDVAEVTYAPYRRMKRMLRDDALVEALQGFEVFVTEIDLVDARSLGRLPDLRVVGSCRGNAVNVDVDACSAFGIPVLNAPGRNADAVADLTLAFLLMLARKLPAATQFLHAPGIEAGDMGAMGRAFATLQGQELWRKTVGLVGLGAVGRKVAARLAGFGARVLVSDPFVSAEQAAMVGAEAVPLETLLRQSDFVSLHAAVTPETTGLLDAAEFALMKPTAFLINSARAALVNETALIEALEKGRIAGAALDTFSVEPPGSDHPFLAMDNVISTPHVGGNTADVSAHQGEIMVTDLRRLLAGEAPWHVLNPAVLADFGLDRPRRTPDAEERARLEKGPAPAVTDLQKKKA